MQDDSWDQMERNRGPRHVCAMEGTCRHPGARAPWLPFGPLWEASGCETNGELARVMGRARRTIEQWKRYGVPVRSADHAAIALGLHPSNVWKEWHRLA